MLYTTSNYYITVLPIKLWLLFVIISVHNFLLGIGCLPFSLAPPFPAVLLIDAQILLAFTYLCALRVAFPSPPIRMDPAFAASTQVSPLPWKFSWKVPYCLNFHIIYNTIMSYIKQCILSGTTGLLCCCVGAEQPARMKN